MAVATPESTCPEQRRRNETQGPTTDPGGRPARKGNGKEAKLSGAGHILAENRRGMIVAIELTQATGSAERKAGLRLVRLSNLLTEPPPRCAG